MLIKLMQPTPVLEGGDVSDKANWHVVRDPQYGYAISYPPNWWTYVADNVRYFYPWTAGGTRYAPYWVEMRVYPNSGHLSAKNGNAADICGGKCQPFPTAAEPVWLRRTTGNADAGTFYDEGYIFDSANVYQLRVSIPVTSMAGASDFDSRMKSGEGVWAVMSGRLLLPREEGVAASVFNGVLFLNGSDLWLANAAGSQNAYRVTRGYSVRQFAQSPDLASVAFAAADPNNENDPWARSIYLARISSSGPVAPIALLSNMEVHDLAWYSDHELLALARSDNGGLAIYKILLPPTKGVPTSGELGPDRADCCATGWTVGGKVAGCFARPADDNVPGACG